MPKKQHKSSRSTLEAFPEESEWAATGEDSMGRNRHRGYDPEPNLVCHRHYDLAHSHEHETTMDGIELLSPKQNGSTVDSSSHDSASKAHNKASIKGMWKKAFKSLKTDSKGSTKDKEEKIDRQESKYSRMSNNRLAVEQVRRSKSQEFRNRKTSTEKYPNTTVNSPPKSPRPTRIDLIRRTVSEPKYKQDYDSITTNESPKSSRQSSLRKFLRRSESKEIKEKERERDREKEREAYAQQDSNDKSSRQSSLKRLMRKDSKEKDPASTPSDSELGPCFEERKFFPGDLDPVFATLRAASGLRRPNRYSESGSEHALDFNPDSELALDFNPDDYGDNSASYNMPPSYSSRDFPR